MAAESVSGTQTWKQTFGYDRFGNRRFDAANTTTLGSCSQVVCDPAISAATNRISESGYSYDANGSLTANAASERFGYDGESHQTEFFAASNQGSTPDAVYTYDGEGRRVKKVSAAETTIFVYDASGVLIAEYSGEVASEPRVSYLTTDHLGSPRVVTDERGSVTSRRDFMPFGEEINGVGGRTTGLNYGSDTIRQKFTGYERDTESDLDFAQARYYNSSHGRFTSVDPLTASATIRNPQTLNRYSYGLNSPYKFTDPLGLLSEYTTGACGNRCLNSDPNGSGGGLVGSSFGMGPGKMYQKEVTSYTVTQSEADGRQATVTITVETDRVLDEKTGAVLDATPSQVTQSDATNTGTTPFSEQDLRTIENVSRDIVAVAADNGFDASLFLAQAQRESHLGIGAWKDPGNVGVAEMAPAINPLQVDGKANGGNYASPTDRKGNILKGMRQLYNEYPNSRSLAERLGHYNAGGNIGSEGRAYARDVMHKMSKIKVHTRYIKGRYNNFMHRIEFPNRVLWPD